jgi:hypothetical protein
MRGFVRRHPATRLALLEKSVDPLRGSTIDHQYRVGVGQRLQRIVAHHVAQRLRVPTAAAENRLLPSWPRITSRLGAHPAGLAALGSQQSIQWAHIYRMQL